MVMVMVKVKAKEVLSLAWKVTVWGRGEVRGGTFSENRTFLAVCMSREANRTKLSFSSLLRLLCAALSIKQEMEESSSQERETSNGNKNLH